jgi:hypothetical protein
VASPDGDCHYELGLKSEMTLPGRRERKLTVWRLGGSNKHFLQTIR